MNLTTAAKTLEKIIMEQSTQYDGQAGSIKDPCARLLFAVIAQSITDLLNYKKMAPEIPAARTKEAIRKYNYRLANHCNAIATADGARAFFFSPGLNDFTDLLGLDTGWIQGKVKTFIGLINEHIGAVMIAKVK